MPGTPFATSRPLYSQYSWAYDRLFTAQVSDRVVFIKDNLKQHGIQPGSLVLDAGCGTGAYSVELARVGYPVMGIDNAPDMVAEAQHRIESYAVACSFLVGDIRHLPLSRCSHAILCRGVLNDLVDDSSRAMVWSEFARILLPGGLLILDVREWTHSMTRKSREPVLINTIETERGRLSFRSETVLDEPQHCLRTTESFRLIAADRTDTSRFEFVMRCWTLAELTAGLVGAGFQVENLYGAYDSAIAPERSDRLVVIASL